MKLNYTLYALVFFDIVFSSCGSDTDPEQTLDCSVSGPLLSLVSTTNVTGCDASDGAFDFDVIGGTGNITFTLNGRTTSTFNNLLAGVYELRAVDENGCAAQLDVDILNSNSSVEIQNIVTTDSGCETNDGTIAVEATGEGEITYTIDDTIVQTDPVFTDLASGDYELIISDESGCDFTTTVRVNSGTSFKGEVQNIINTNCAISGCHTGATGGSSNFTIFSNIQNNANSIQSRTTSGNMPPASSGLSLSATEIGQITCWVEDGALDN